MRLDAPQIERKHAAENRPISLDIRPYLDSGVSATGTVTPTITPTTVPALTFTTPKVNTVTTEIIGEDVPAGGALVGLAGGGLAGTRYYLTLQVDTDATPTGTITPVIALDVLE